MTSSPMELAGQLTMKPCGVASQPIDEGFHVGSRPRQDDTESPGAGRAKLRLSRGFPRGLAYDVIPYGIGQPTDKGFHVGSRRKAG